MLTEAGAEAVLPCRSPSCMTLRPTATVTATLTAMTAVTTATEATRMSSTRRCASDGCVPGSPWRDGGHLPPGAAAARCETRRIQIRPCTCGGYAVRGTPGRSGRCMMEVRGQGGAPPPPMQTWSLPGVRTMRCRAPRVGARRLPDRQLRRWQCGQAAATSSPPFARPRRRCHGCGGTRARLRLLQRRQRRAVGTRRVALLVGARCRRRHRGRGGDGYHRLRGPRRQPAAGPGRGPFGGCQPA